MRLGQQSNLTSLPPVVSTITRQGHHALSPPLSAGRSKNLTSSVTHWSRVWYECFLLYIQRRSLQTYDSCERLRCCSVILDVNKNDSGPPSPPNRRPSQLPRWSGQQLYPHPHYSHLRQSRIYLPWLAVDNPPSLFRRFRDLRSLTSLIYLRCA